MMSVRATGIVETTVTAEVVEETVGTAVTGTEATANTVEVEAVTATANVVVAADLVWIRNLAITRVL
jgi:hypothetical protein